MDDGSKKKPIFMQLSLNLSGTALTGIFQPTFSLYGVTNE
jgi:hypothetical protein